MPDGRSLEMHYQLDDPPHGKGYCPGGTDWRLGKGKPPLDLSVDLWSGYLGLWRIWARTNVPLMRELFLLVRGQGNGCLLSDMFATTPINQAHALSVILNELCGFPQP
jgi:hypothetical protein